MTSIGPSSPGGSLPRPGTSPAIGPYRRSDALTDIAEPRKIRRLLMGSLLFGCLAAFVVAFDRQCAALFAIGNLPGDLRKAVELSEAFAHGAGAAVILIAIWICASQPRRPVVALAIVMTLSSGLIANGLKACFVRIRPHAEGAIIVRGEPASNARILLAEQEDPEKNIVEASFWDARQRSFPSGHAATATGLALGLSLLFPRAAGLFAALAVLACFQRVSSGAHYPSDVLAGAAIAGFVAFAILSIVRRHNDRSIADIDHPAQLTDCPKRAA